MSYFDDKSPNVRRFRGPGGLDMLRLTAGQAVAEVAPSRGGIVTRFAVGKDEVLFLDPKTLADRKEKVRGGIPVLFPAAGRLTGDRYLIDGLGFPMRQHGIARHAAWTVIDVAQAHLTMEFRSSTVTKITYPFDFVCKLTVDVGRAGYRSLVLDMEIENLDKKPMPVHFGLHPYFLVPDKDKPGTTVQISAESAYDNTSGSYEPWNGVLDFTAPEVDLHLTNVQRGTATLEIPGRSPRKLSFSDGYSVLVLWTVAMKEFICVEPWSGPADALNTGVGLRTLEPGDKCRGEFVISV